MLRQRALALQTFEPRRYADRADRSFILKTALFRTEFALWRRGWLSRLENRIRPFNGAYSGPGPFYFGTTELRTTEGGTPVHEGTHATMREITRAGRHGDYQALATAMQEVAQPTPKNDNYIRLIREHLNDTDFDARSIATLGETSKRWREGRVKAIANISPEAEATARKEGNSMFFSKHAGSGPLREVSERMDAYFFGGLLGAKAAILRHDLGFGADRRFLYYLSRGHSTHSAEIAVRDEFRKPWKP